MFRPKREGAGNAGRAMRPQPRMQNKKAYEHSHHGHTGLTRHSPRNGFNGFLRALPSDRAFLPLSSADRPANLMPASGHQDHTTSPSASVPFVKSTNRVHRIPRSTSVTIAIRPSDEAGWNRDIPASTQRSSVISEIQKLVGADVPQSDAS